MLSPCPRKTPDPVLPNAIMRVRGSPGVASFVMSRCYLERADMAVFSSGSSSLRANVLKMPSTSPSLLSAPRCRPAARRTRQRPSP